MTSNRMSTPISHRYPIPIMRWQDIVVLILLLIAIYCALLEQAHAEQVTVADMGSATAICSDSKPRHVLAPTGSVITYDGRGRASSVRISSVEETTLRARAEIKAKGNLKKLHKLLAKETRKLTKNYLKRYGDKKNRKMIAVLCAKAHGAGTTQQPPSPPAALRDDLCARADRDGDGIVDQDDLMSLITSFGHADDLSDIDRDGLVDIDDLIILLSIFNQQCPVASSSSSSSSSSLSSSSQSSSSSSSQSSSSSSSSSEGGQHSSQTSSPQSPSSVPSSSSSTSSISSTSTSSGSSVSSSSSSVSSNGTGSSSSANPNTAGALKPIANWSTVPHQRISQGESINIGVVAFSKHGIEKVRFTVPTLPEITVTTMSINPQTLVHEYWFSLSGSSVPLGSFNVSATVYGNDGGERTLAPLAFFGNPTGSVPRPVAWVDVNSGNDSTGQVNQLNKPFSTIKRAIERITNFNSQYRGIMSPQGGVVYLNAGIHTASLDYVVYNCPDEWLIISAAPGLSREQVILQTSGGGNVKKIALRGITMNGKQIINPNQAGAPGTMAWVDNVAAHGGGRWIGLSYVIGQNFTKVFFTDSYLTDSDFAVPAGGVTELARNLTIRHIGNDAFQNVPTVINIDLDDVYPPDPSWHADVIGDGGYGAPPVRIAYNIRATNLHYQGILSNFGTSLSAPVEGQAFVNMYLELADPIIGMGGGSGYYHNTSHFVMWHVTFASKASRRHGFGFHSEALCLTSNCSQVGYIPTQMNEVSMIGNVFDSTDNDNSGLLTIDTTDIRHNHFSTTFETMGTSYTTGDPLLDSNGTPLANSPLLNKIAPNRTTVDLDNSVRDNFGDVGAYER